MLKILKDSTIYTAMIFIFNFFIKLIFNPDNITSNFEKGLWYGLAVYLTSLVALFIIILIIISSSRLISKSKNSKNK